jgi:tetratricopeptide (TPR) repeat protein
MTTPPARPRRIRACKILVLICAFCLSGCHGLERLRSLLGIGNAQADPQEDWLAGSNRAPTARTLYATARVLSAQGRDDKAQLVLLGIIERHPHFAPAYVTLAELYMRHRRVGKAREVLSVGLNRRPNDPVLLNDMGMCWMVQGRYDQALPRFQQAAAAAPGEARYQANAALALGLLGRYDEALELYRRILPAADAHHNLAVACELRKDHARAAQERAKAKMLRRPTTRPQKPPGPARQAP